MTKTSDEIREAFLSFFERRDHRRRPSASLVPATFDASVLLTTAGMHPLKPYFLGQEQPPHARMTSCQKCFRTTDIDNVGNTHRHLTFFEMLGNFSIGDYFKQGAIEAAWELSTQGFGFDPEKIWVTVFGGDEELGLDADEEAIALWQAIGVPRERIVECPRAENFWQAGPTGPCGPCSELYLDRGLDFGAADDLPGGENERFLEFWNLVFMQFDQDPPNTLTPLPAANIDTGLGLNRLAAILQGKESVFETDQFLPLVQLGEELSGRRYGQDETTTRSLRILADHARAMTFLVADGVVPSNEDRGYILRRVMRRAIQHGRALGFEPGFLPRFATVVEETMGGAYPELAEHRDAIHKWLRAEEEGFGRTLEQGTKLLDELIAQAQEQGEEGLGAADVFTLHDTYGFPFDLTKEIAAEHDLGVDEPGFERLMGEQRARARAGGARGGAGAADADVLRARAQELAGTAGFASEFVGYETTEQATSVGALEQEDRGRMLVKLVESPFYPAGGGQVSDAGFVECADGDCRARVEQVLRLAGGEDQVLVLAPEVGELKPGEAVRAVVDHRARHATQCNHTATHLLHAALRARLGTHVRQAGSAVQPDKLRFDFTHGQALSSDELRAVEADVNEWILENHPVRALTTTLDEAKSRGAMALFGEKYGDLVRMVEVGDGSFSRELCGGTHVRSTAEIGLFRIVSETSSAANVRRIEALTGPAAVQLVRAHDDALRTAAEALRATPEQVPVAVAQALARVKELEKAARKGGSNGALELDSLVASASTIDGAAVVAAAVEVGDPKALPDLADKLKAKLGDAAVVLGAVADGKVHLVATVAPALVARGVKAGMIVRVAAEVTGGGGGGRDTMARAGGRDPDKLPEAIAAARAAIEAALAS